MCLEFVGILLFLGACVISIVSYGCCLAYCAFWVFLFYLVVIFLDGLTALMLVCTV